MTTPFVYAVLLSLLFIQGLDALQYSSVAQIYPERADITVDAGTNLTLGCRGAEPMLWTFQDDYNGPNFNKSVKNITYMFNDKEIEYKNETILTVFNVTTRNIGFYYCHGAAVDFNTPRRSSRIYVFVNDECTFTLNNEQNVENVRTCATKYPKINVCTSTQYPKKINICAGIFNNQIIGPFNIMRNLSTNSYLELLPNNVGPALEHAGRPDQVVWFQHDECPAHYDDNQLSLIPSEEYEFLDAYWVAFIPCRPTAQDINITVICEDNDKVNILTMSVHPGNFTAVHEGEDHVGKFHSYHGFQFHFPESTPGLTNWSCIFTRNNATSLLKLTATFISESEFYGHRMSIEGPATADVGDEITLQCAFIDRQYLPVNHYWIQWDVPASGNIQTEILQVIKLKANIVVLSIIKINNISNEDEGDYKCRGYNELFRKASLYVYVNDKKSNAGAPRISYPTGGEVQINAGENITLRCEGPRPVTWTHRQVKKSYSIEHINVGGRYETYLHLTKASYENSGFYNCFQNGSAINHPFHSDSIYMFVNDAQYLHVPKEGRYNYIYPYSNVTVPCLPTSRDVNVSLSMVHKHYDSNTGRYGPRQNITPVIYAYDPREGFAVQMPGGGWATATCTFVTETARDTVDVYYEITEHAFYKITEPLITGPHEDLVFVGQTLALSCFVFVYHNVSDDALRWTLPNDVTTSIPIVEIRRINTYTGKVIVSKLTLRDVEAANDGRYSCHSLHNNVTTSKDITVYDMFPVNKPCIEYVHYNYAYIGQPLLLRCKVIVSHNVGYRISWTTPDNTEIQDPNIEYIPTIRNTSGEIILKIQNTTLENAGNYSCNVFYTTNNSNGTSKHIIVKRGEKPSIVTSNFKNQEEIFMVVGEIVTLTCSAEGDPQPVFTWMKGSTAVRRLYPYIDFAADNSELIVRSSPEFDAGLYTCVAQNPFGRDSRDVHLRLTTALSIPYRAVVILLVILFIVASVALARWSYKRKMLRKKLIKDGFMNFKSRELQSLLNIAEQTALLPYDTKWEIPRNNIELGRNLGSGYFGLVVEATVSNYFDGEPEKTVAVKMLHRHCYGMDINTLICELQIMIHVGEHVNLIKLLGASADRMTAGNLFVVIEYCEHGSLRNYLIENRSNFVNLIDPDTELICFPDTDDDTDSLQDFLCASDAEANDGDGDDTTRPAELNTLQLLRWALQVAHGMEFLASKQILHGDLALRNVLLAANSVVKICDFGLSKTLSSSGYYKKSSQCPLPIKWMAIESIRYKTFSTQSDVWAFGVVLWELFSLAQTPYAELDPDFRFYRLLESGHRLQRPDYSTREIYQVMRECWSDRPQTRPTFSCLVQTLTDLLQHPNKRCSAEIDECAAASVLASTLADPAAPDWVALDILPSSSTAAGILETHL